MTEITCFKAYDVRGRVPDELNEDIAYRIARAYCNFIKPKRVAVGHDIRLSSISLARAVTRGLVDSGVNAVTIGTGGTELIYFATFHDKLDGGIMITASHNPPDYNGMKFVREGSRPISRDTGLQEIRALAETNNFEYTNNLGSVSERDIFFDYIAHLLSYIDIEKLEPLKIVVNAGNGGAGPIIDLLEPHLPFEFIKLHHEPDGAFPNGIPNPMIEENRQGTSDRVVETEADLGIAWDGDYDRCFFFDSQGRFIEGYYIVGLLAHAFLENSPGETIVHDPRLTWNTLEIIEQGNGKAIESISGHSFMKHAMRESNAAYGGEMSAHHYFRDFSYADSGMIPWLLVASIMSQTGQSLAALINERMTLFPASGEINRKVVDADEVLKKAETLYAKNAILVDHTDGLSVQFADWRFNLRSSNTEPLVRLNVESRGNQKLMQERTEELLVIIGGRPG